MNTIEEVGPIGNAIRMVERLLNTVAGILLLGMMFLGAIDVIGRYLFNSPILGALEASQIMMGGMVFLSWSYTLAHREHVTVDILTITYSKTVREILHIVMMLVSLLLFALITWKSAEVARMDWEKGKLVRTLLIPIAPFKTLVPLGSFLLCLECIIQMFHSALTLFHRRKN